MGQVVAKACQFVADGVRVIACGLSEIFRVLLTEVGKWLVGRIEAPTERDLRSERAQQTLDKAHNQTSTAKVMTAAAEGNYIAKAKDEALAELDQDDYNNVQNFLREQGYRG